MSFCSSFRPLAGKWFESKLPVIVRASGASRFRPLAGKWFERTSKQLPTNHYLAFPSPCGEVV